MRLRHGIVALVALLAIGWGVWVLESARAGLVDTVTTVDGTPVTRLHDGTGTGPVVVVAHGFAGSRQMMRGYTEVLAQAGYDTWAFDFLGHGRHEIPMSGDVSALDGTTRLLVEQTRAVIDAAARDGPVAVLGHSMASDVLVRAAMEDPRIGPMVLLSGFSLAIDDRHPQDLLAIAGAWEPGLSTFALNAARMVDPEAQYGETVTTNAVRRQAMIAPYTEHVAILHSRAGRAATLDWLNTAYGRTTTVPVRPTGWALLALLAGLTALSLPLARLMAPARPVRATDAMGWRRRAILLAVPMVATPLLAAPFDLHVLPVLVADYLALHLAIYGLLQGGLLWRFGQRADWPHPLASLALLVWALATFGLALDRYGANFWPVGDRVWIILALALGALPFMLSDSIAAAHARLGWRIVLRMAFLISLVAAILLDPEGLFFLAMIAPVIVLFWLTFGLMGRWVSARAGPATAGLALGLVLAWALGVSFPLFAG
ncbi:alpha/beta hydrolase [Cognatishimia sp. F0-27]|uniref:alpha/beta hydrolase n=1 Tax=Cognatishimia sp. F0-27 TaxID=2816855 RepID=UPI001D0BF5D2|nr:alpha/beta fold hydrolase [Cognatishimia sp. F0-27]MCC1491034.1 alpha/beta fold hydrolase [Cognatishimia sp. F0-27]